MDITFLFFFVFIFPFCFPFCVPVLFPRCVSPLCLPVVSPPGGDPNATSRGERFALTRARALVENESEQFPVASSVPVAPQWGEQRGKTTGTTIGKHNGGNKTGNSREKWKNMYVFLCIFYLLNCFKIMSVCKSKEKMKITDFFWTIFLKMGTSPKSSVFATVGSRTSTQQRGSATG